MIEDFRGAIGAVAEAAENQPSQLRAAVSAVFQLADRVPADTRIEGLAALTGTLRAHQRTAGVAADIALLCGALVESGVPAGPAGMEVMSQLAEYGKMAGVFLDAWQKSGDDAPPHPGAVSDASEERVTPALEHLAPLATTGWWVSHRYGLAAKTMLGDSGVRAALSADPRMLGELIVIAARLRPHVEEYGEIAELLHMAEAAPVPVPGAPPLPAEPWGEAQAYQHDFVPPPVPDHGAPGQAVQEPAPAAVQVPPPAPWGEPVGPSARSASAGATPPGAVHMDPLPAGVSDSSGWGPSWKD
ncbi:hypothetical protein ACFWTE_14470 [Nocardiopsis sp. NPDC058631]|uniref:hypothetical protein n=1 Tax=Nocardiopsis sp. NPDC058631 TaxID=3346566 RepID=UPI003657A920